MAEGPSDEILTVAEVAKILRLHPKTIYKLIKQGKLPAQRIVEIHGQDVARWLYVDRNFFYFYGGIGSDANDGILEVQRRVELWENLFPNAGLRAEKNQPSHEILENILFGYIACSDIDRSVPTVTTPTTAGLNRTRLRLNGDALRAGRLSNRPSVMAPDPLAVYRHVNYGLIDAFTG